MGGGGGDQGRWGRLQTLRCVHLSFLEEKKISAFEAHSANILKYIKPYLGPAPGAGIKPEEAGV